MLIEIDAEYNIFPVGMRVCEDWACFHRIALISSLVFIGTPLGIRNNNVEGQITKISDEKRKELYQDVVIYYNLLFNFLVTKKLKYIFNKILKV